ncbi:hypothetical protein QVD17_31874 [Tagetes erecta]|uniref:GDSL esterase/lipase 6 n=1 Tax=Tagetes erecta TaxID=13708 RepID=A0AAD8NPN0_TARER|nr:hypothetical protein QVD17_31874 [Tagetes erecta]
MERLIPQLIIFVSVFVSALAPADAYVKSILVFGDSQLDPGNNKFIKNCLLQANYTPYGLSYFRFPTGRFSNGRIVPDFLAQYLGIEFQKPYEEVYRKLAKDRRMRFPANGLNFASGGSGLLQDTNKKSRVTTIKGQLQQFQDLIAQRRLHKIQVRNSLVLLEVGSTDILSYFLFPGASNMTLRTYVHTMLKEVIRFTSIIYKNGGRRIVLMSVGPVGCLPGRVAIRDAPTNKCVDKINNMVKYFNAGLKRIVFNIPRMFPRAIGVYGSMFETVKKFRVNPKLYGFTNVTHACCGGGPLNGVLRCGARGYKLCSHPNQYFFWDNFHPTEHTYKLVSKAFWGGSKKEAWPINLKTLARIPPFA